MKLRHLPLLALPLLGVAAPATSGAQIDPARRAQAFIAGLDFDDARHVLSAADPDSPPVALERARLAIYELDCDGAAAILARPEVQKLESGEMLADIARGCQRVTAALAVDRDEARSIEVRWQDEHDRPLAPLLFDTVAAARDALTRDLKVDWPRPTRIVVVRDLLSLSAMTGLPYKSAQTTGTVAVAKWGRVTLLSPRASHHGYQWRDTVAHELTHLAVTRASRDQAPLWLQEGVAKREEVRWREPGPLDDRPSPDAVVQRGLELNLGLPLDKLGPSIAMLPSADAAMVAFAEVTSFVRYYAREAGDDALPKLLDQIRSGKEPDAALHAASGADLAAWDTRWRSYVASRPHQPLPGLFGLGGSPGDEEKLRDLRDRRRLAELLLVRGHATEAVEELDRIALAASPTGPEGWDRLMQDPSVRWLRARALEAVGRRAEAQPLVADPKEVLSSYGPWWAIRGRWARLGGDEATATASFIEAVAADPFGPESACETIDPAVAPPDPTKKALCDAARAAGPEWEGD
ncbi:MAG: peptidase MA family metallohydrolase [Polyangiaceae bacterium]